MKIFLSWSGGTSKQVAEALWKWLPYMIQSIKPFISSGDISKGDTWNEVLAHELKDAEYGIICVTPYNVYKPWMIFEAGAMAHFVGRSRVTPLLFRISPEALDKGPLSQFQSTALTRDDFYRLIFSINRASKSDPCLDNDLLERSFDHWWSKLNEDLDKIKETSSETRTFYSWLRTFDDLAIHDPASNCRVWIVTADAFTYAIQGEVKKKIQANLENIAHPEFHMDYRYLFPDSLELRKDYEKDLEQLKKEHATGFDYRFIDPKVFERRAPSDFVMIESRDRDTPKVFVRAPIDDIGAKYWFEAGALAADGFFKRFHDLWENPSDAEPDRTM